MAGEIFEAPLRDDERAALREWADEPGPADFADRVVEAWTHEHDPDDDTEAAPEPTVVPLRRRRSVRLSVAVAVCMAAALLVGWWSRSAMQDRREQRERAARLAAPQVPAPTELVNLRDEAHHLLSEHCAPCHDSTHAEAKTDALAVFDVRAERWWLTMSDRQLRDVVDRMAARDGMPPAAIDGISRYVEVELSFRSEGHG